LYVNKKETTCNSCLVRLPSCQPHDGGLEAEVVVPVYTTTVRCFSRVQNL